MKLNQALKKKRLVYAKRHDKLILLHDNARSHLGEPVKPYWKVLPHPPYLPDIQYIKFFKDIEKWINEWITSKARIYTGVESICCVKDEHTERKNLIESKRSWPMRYLFAANEIIYLIQ